MKALFFVVLLLVGYSTLPAQPVIARSNPDSFNPQWAPFYHGVASGDPMEDRVIIWTRVTPPEPDGSPIEVTWRMATDVSLENIVKSGTFITDASRDYTVKVDVIGLQPGTTYYYEFSALGKNSLIGKTKTTPTGDQAQHLRFGVVSCSNFQAGYFNVYRRLAARNDLDAIIHLGDYIYEVGDRVYGDSALFGQRPLEPPYELQTLDDYRARYATYRLDTCLVRAHQQHPFITVWDDHEFANNAYKDGAENQDENTWEARKAAAKQAYFEWLPIRDNETRSVYRKISYGNLLDLIMLDTRIEGRDKDIEDINDPELNNPNRTILGTAQKQWLFDQLSQSTARWKVIGQQVMFSEFNVGWGALADESYTYDELESLFLDIWDGYPAERSQIIQFIKNNNINDVVILSGDLHSSFAFDVKDHPVNVSFQTVPIVGLAPVYSLNGYDPSTGEGSVAVEFLAPSVTSLSNAVNVLGLDKTLLLEKQINKTIEPIPGLFNLGNPNPHMKYVDLVQHGYYLLDVKPDSTQANFYYADINEINQNEAFAAAWYTKNGENHLKEAAGASAPKALQDTPAPDEPRNATGIKEVSKKPQLAILSVYPNPANHLNTLQFALSASAQIRIDLYDEKGMLVRNLFNKNLPVGTFSLQTAVNNLPNGVYFYKIQVNEKQYNAKVVVVK